MVANNGRKAIVEIFSNATEEDASAPQSNNSTDHTTNYEYIANAQGEPQSITQYSKRLRTFLVKVLNKKKTRPKPRYYNTFLVGDSEANSRQDELQALFGTLSPDAEEGNDDDDDDENVVEENNTSNNNDEGLQDLQQDLEESDREKEDGARPGESSDVDEAMSDAPDNEENEAASTITENEATDEEPEDDDMQEDQEDPEEQEEQEEQEPTDDVGEWFFSKRDREYVNPKERRIFETLCKFFPWLDIDIDGYYSLPSKLCRYQFLHLVYQVCKILYYPFRDLLEQAQFPFAQWEACFDEMEKFVMSNDHEDFEFSALDTLLLGLDKQVTEKKLSALIAPYTKYNAILRLNEKFASRATKHEIDALYDALKDGFFNKNTTNFSYLQFLCEYKDSGQDIDVGVLTSVVSNQLVEFSVVAQKQILSSSIVDCLKNIPFLPPEIRARFDEPQFNMMTKIAFGYWFDKLNKEKSTENRWKNLTKLRESVGVLAMFLAAVKTHAFAKPRNDQQQP